jgi:integrase
MWSMSPVSKTYRLDRRNGHYRYRRVVPESYRVLLGKKTIIDSLGTTKLATAIKRRALKDVEYDTLFEQFKHQLEKQAEPPTITKVLATELVRAFVARLDEKSAKELAEHPPTSSEELSVRLSDAEEEWASLADPAFLTTHGLPRSTFEEVTSGIAYKFDGDVFSYSQFYDLVVRALRELRRRDIARLRADHEQASHDAMFDQKAGGPAAAATHGPGWNNQRSFSDLCADYSAAYSEEATLKGVHKKRVDKVNGAVRFLEVAIGSDLSLDEVDYQACQAFRKLLARTPSNSSKLYPSMSPREAAEAAAKDGRSLLSHVSQSFYLRTLTAILKHGTKLGWLSNVPSEGMQPLVPQAPAAEKRRPFSMDDLNSIFSAPLYTGCVDDAKGFAKPGPNVIRGTRFWVPLIALWTGMRANEICQLDKKAIYQDDGIWVFDLYTNDEKALVKNKSSRRKFPMHPKLIEFGLLELHATRCEKSDDLLFPDLTPDSYGYRSTKLTRWFDDSFLPKYVADRNQKSFHSFRHSFRDELRRIDAPSPILNSLCGWQESGAISDNYGSGYKTHQLLKWVARVEHPDLCLSHLAA